MRQASTRVRPLPKLRLSAGRPYGRHAGFLARVSEKKTVAETYEAVNYPHVPPQQGAESVNDLGQIVGEYLDSSGDFHGYEWAGGKFSQINVPFAGATGTFPFGINNSGEVVGGWNDSDGNEHGFTLIGSTYASFDYPGATYTHPTMSTAQETSLVNTKTPAGLAMAFC